MSALTGCVLTLALVGPLFLVALLVLRQRAYDTGFDRALELHAKLYPACPKNHGAAPTWPVEPSA